MLDAFIWWLTFLLLGLAALPITLALFRNLPDRGYAFSRPLGLLLFGYLYWVGVDTGILPNSRTGVEIAVAALLALAYIVHRRRGEPLARVWQTHRREIIVTELVFAGVFVLWAWVRSHTPAIEHTEQPMDFAMLNAVLRSPEFPPNDPWFAGASISYYYFGYLMTAGVVKLSGVAPAVGYNLALASFAAMAATGAMGLTYNIVATLRRNDGLRASAGTAMRFGLLAALLLVFMGNLVGLLEFFQTNGIGPQPFWEWLGVDGLTGVSRSPSWHPDDSFWFWRSTRIINNAAGSDYTITEFPAFSFILGDLHPHVMALPFMLLAMALAFNALRARAVWGLAWVQERPWELVAIGLVLGGLGFLNSWDLPTFTVLFLAAVALNAIHARAAGRGAGMVSVAIATALLLLLIWLMYAPFTSSLQTQVNSRVPIAPVRAAMTRPIHAIVFWGPLLLLALALVLRLGWETFAASARMTALRLLGADGVPAAPGQPWRRSIIFRAAALALLPFAIWAAVEIGLAASGASLGLAGGRPRSINLALLAIGSRSWHLLPYAAVLALALAVLGRKASRDGAASASLQFALLAVAVALFLVMGAELFHLNDLFGNRMNTVFKLYYQAWALLAVAGAVGLYHWTQVRTASDAARRGPLPATVLAIAAVSIAAAFLFLPAAIWTKTDHLRTKATLDGTAWVLDSDPGEWSAYQWLLEHARGGDVIVEALPLDQAKRPTGDYQAGIARVSARTGQPAVLGWPGHEHQWGRDDAAIAERARDIDTIYRSTDAQTVRAALAKYGVRYVIAGALERQTYGVEVNARLAAVLPPAYSGPGVVVYGNP